MAETIDMQIKLLGYVKIKGEIEALTGLHIGGTADSIDKGGIDNPVIKNPVTNVPYIPGSSLRGRMRSLLEKKTAKKLYPMTKDIWMELYKEEKDALGSQVCRVFGNSISKRSVPSVLIVRDALYTKNTLDHYMQGGKGGLPITEAKMEIAVDRITAHPLPRTIERVPAGAKFDFEIIYKVQTYENGKFDATSPDVYTKSDDKLKQDLKNILWALEQIETYDGLGGNTSRGYGQVEICIKELTAIHYKDLIKLATQETLSNNDSQPSTNIDCDKMKKSFVEWCKKIDKIIYSKDLSENHEKNSEESPKN